MSVVRQHLDRKQRKCRYVTRHVTRERDAPGKTYNSRLQRMRGFTPPTKAIHRRFHSVSRDCGHRSHLLQAYDVTCLSYQ